jgi:hypothetical protein
VENGTANIGHGGINENAQGKIPLVQRVVNGIYTSFLWVFQVKILFCGVLRVLHMQLLILSGSIAQLESMRKINSTCQLLFLLCALSIAPLQWTYSQCVNTQLGGQSGCTRSGFFYGEIVPFNGTTPVSVSPYSPGEYFRVPVLAGGCYTISTCGAPFDTQINCFEGVQTTGPFAYDDDSGPMCGGLAASCTMVPNFTDYARVDVRQYPCQAGGSSSITVSIFQNNNLSITSSSASMCQGQTRNLTAVPAAVTGSLANSGDEGTFTGTGVSGTVFTAPVPGGSSQNYNVNYSFGYITVSQSITVFHTPTTSNAGPSQTVCTGGTTLSANAPTFGTGQWTIVSGPGSLTSPTSPNSGITGLVAGQTTVVRWTISNGVCTSSQDTVSIFRDVDPSVANAGPDQAVCSDTINLAANTPAVGSGNWTRIAGSGVIQNSSNPNSAVFGLGLGTNVFVWTVYNGVCLATTDTVVFTRDANSPQALAGPDKQICDAFTTLTGNIPASGIGLWSVISGTGVVTTPNSPNSPLTGVSIGTSMLTWSITNGTCPASVDTLLVTRSALPNPPTVNGNQDACIGETVTLTASSSATSPSYVWWDAPAGGNALSGGATYTSPPLFGNIVVYLEVTDGVTNCTSTRTQFNVTVHPLPVVALGNDTTFCDSDSLCMDAGAGMSTYNWNSGATTQVYCTNVTGTYWVEVMDVNGCHGMDTISISTNPAPAVNLGPNFTLCNGNSATIGVTPQGGQTYQWSTSASTPTIVVNTANTYSLTVSDLIGCSNTDAIVVTTANTPTASFSMNSSGCPVIAFTDLSTDASTWSWSFGDGSSSPLQSPSYNYQASGNGTYTVTMIASGPCGADTTSQSLLIDCVVGLSLPSNLSIGLFPNPNDGIFKVRLEGLEADARLEVFNELGQQVYVKNIEGCRGECEETVNLKGVAAGMYMAQITVGDAVISKRVVIR